MNNSIISAQVHKISIPANHNYTGYNLTSLRIREMKPNCVRFMDPVTILALPDGTCEILMYQDTPIWVEAYAPDINTWIEICRFADYGVAVEYCFCLFNTYSTVGKGIK